MTFVRWVPANEAELEELFGQLSKNARHVRSLRVSDLRIEIDLDWAANRQRPDIYIPLKRQKLKEALDLASRLQREVLSGYPATRSEISALFACIDPSGY